MFVWGLGRKEREKKKTRSDVKGELDRWEYENLFFYLFITRCTRTRKRNLSSFILKTNGKLSKFICETESSNILSLQPENFLPFGRVMCPWEFSGSFYRMLANELALRFHRWTRHFFEVFCECELRHIFPLDAVYRISTFVSVCEMIAKIDDKTSDSLWFPVDFSWFG